MSLPLQVRFPQGARPADRSAETRDISFRGLYFMLDENHQVGTPIEFILTLPKEITLAGDVQIRCLGQVVRVDDHEGRCGIAARIDSYEFLPVSA